MKRILYFLPFAVFLVITVMLYILLQQNLKLSQATPDVSIDRSLPEFAIQGLKSSDIKGASLIHITASWCAVCKIENPLLMQLSKTISIYGVAWKDDPKALEEWHRQAGNPYKKLGFDDGKLAIELGATGTPESFVISKDRRIIAHIKGPLTDEMVEREIVSRLK